MATMNFNEQSVDNCARNTKRARPRPLTFVSFLPTQPASTSGSCQRSVLSLRSPRLKTSLYQRKTWYSSIATEREPETKPAEKVEYEPSQPPSRMFSNIAPSEDGTLRRVPASELGCAALVAGTTIGAGVLALPSVAAPAGFIPSSFALCCCWAYMAATGLLISEVTINTACTLGRPVGVSLLSLGELTLGKAGALVTAASYTFLHYAILTAYTAQGGAMLSELIRVAEMAGHLSTNPPFLPQATAGALFAAAIGGCMYALSENTVEKINNTLVAGVIATFIAVVAVAGSHVDPTRLLSNAHWAQLGHGPLVPVLFVSCVYHNVVSTITMRLEGDRRKLRRVILGGSAIPLAMFLMYNAAILGSGSMSSQDTFAVAGFSLLAVATSFVGFVQGLTDLWEDVRLTSLKQSEGKVLETRYQNFIATLVPPVMFTAVSPDIFLQALDAAGTYGIAILFGGLPAAMAWRNRRARLTKGFQRLVGGGDILLAGIGAIPALLIGNKVWESLHHSM